jgi:hypothetical protein
VAEAPAPAPEVLPNVELTGDLLYRITKAELEFKQGQWQGPYITMMALAQQTRDPRLARRAAEMALTAKQPQEAVGDPPVAQLAPDSDEAIQFFLGFAVAADDLSEAEAAFEQRLKRAAGRASAGHVPDAAIPAARQGQGGRFALTERVLLPYDGMLETHLILAQGAFALNDAARAREEAGKALAIKPDSELAILTKAQVAGDIDSAVKLLTGFLQRIRMRAKCAPPTPASWSTTSSSTRRASSSCCC